jgi:hypothetical protein
MMELKPCPFCGGAMTCVYNSFDNAFKFYHKYEGMSDFCRVFEPISLRAISLADAKEAWNRRVNP